MIQSKFKIGDKVKIINLNKVYPTYKEMVGIMDLKNWQPNKGVKNGSVATIINIEIHREDLHIMLNGIRLEDETEYIISEDGLELLTDIKPLNIIKMNKQQTIETLQKQLPSFYSLEQVISIINGIEDNNNTLNDDSIQMIIKSIRRSLIDSKDLVDHDSAEFEIGYNNQIELSNIEVDIEGILDIVAEELNDFAEAEPISDISDIVELERG
jgi:hypothetical protein